MSICLMSRSFLTHIPYPQLLVSRGSDKEGTVGTPRLRLNNVAELQRQLRCPGLDIPDLDRKVA